MKFCKVLYLTITRLGIFMFVVMTGVLILPQIKEGTFAPQVYAISLLIVCIAIYIYNWIKNIKEKKK